MKTNFLILTLFIISLAFMPSAMAVRSSSPVNLSGSLSGTVDVITAGGNINTTINGSTGALGAAFNPAFEMRSNDPDLKHLTMAVTANTTSGYQNAVYNVGATTYIIMTNNAFPPNVSSLNDIKTGSPTPANNPNAIAWMTTGPSDDTGNVTITYQSVPKNWDCRLTSSGYSKTTFTVPASTPFTNTFSAEDEAGDYKANVTLSFNP